MVGAALKSMRKARGWNQTELAERMGKRRPTVARMESATANPAWNTICRALEALEATPQDLARVVHEMTNTEWRRSPEESAGLERAANALEHVAVELRKLS